jgi:hypothetical protein
MPKFSKDVATSHPRTTPQIRSISKKDIPMTKATHNFDRRQFIGGSDARLVMGTCVAVRMPRDQLLN